MTKPRKGQFGEMLNRPEFHSRFCGSFGHPAFLQIGEALAQVEEVAWDTYIDEKKLAHTEKAGAEFSNPDYELPVEWKQTRDRLLIAETMQKNAGTRYRVLLICGSDRNDGTCPGEMSKTFQLTQIARQVLEHF